MGHVLRGAEEDLFQSLGRAFHGVVVTQSGKRSLRVERKIELLPSCLFVELPPDVKVFHRNGRAKKPQKGRKFFISLFTQNPHIIVEATELPLIQNEV